MVGEKQEAKHEEENMQLRKAIAEKEAVLVSLNFEYGFTLQLFLTLFLQ